VNSSHGKRSEERLFGRFGMDWTGLAEWKEGQRNQVSVSVTQRKFRGFLSNFGRFERRRQLLRCMKNNKAKDAKDRNTQKHENRAYNLASERLRLSKNPPQAHPEKCGTRSEQQEVRPRNILGNRESCEDKEIAYESPDVEYESQPDRPVPTQFSRRSIRGSACRLRQNISFSNSPDPQPLHKREYHYHFGDDPHDPFSTDTKRHHKEKRVASDNPRGVQDDCDPGVQQFDWIFSGEEHQDGRKHKQANSQSAQVDRFWETEKPHDPPLGKNQHQARNR